MQYNARDSIVMQAINSELSELLSMKDAVIHNS